MGTDDSTQDVDALPLLLRLEEFEEGRNYPSLSSCDASTSEDEGSSRGGDYNPSSESDSNISSGDGYDSEEFSSDGERKYSGGDDASRDGSDSSNNNDDGDASSSANNEADGSLPRLRDLHEGCGGDTFEGGPGNLKFNTKAARSHYYPFRNFSQTRLFDFVFNHQLSRVQTCALLEMLRAEDAGNIFDIKDLEGVSGESFVAKMRKYLPLIEVLKRKVPRSGGADIGTTADVLDFPPNLLLERYLMSPSSTQRSFANPGGKVLREGEAEQNGLASDHVFSGPVRPRGDARRANMHGRLACSSPFHGYDGVIGKSTGQRIHVNDVALCEFGVVGSQPCRVMAQFWDEESEVLMASVRRFHKAEEVEGGPENGTTYEGLVRVWEEEGPQSEINVSCSSLLALLEIYTAAEVSAGLHKGDSTARDRSQEWDTCVGEGFVTKQRRKRVRDSDGGVVPLYRVTSVPWLREGTPDEPLFTIRNDSFRHNVNNMPFASTPIVIYIDGFNAFGMGNKVCWC